jgi:hypothetical protein
MRENPWPDNLCCWPETGIHGVLDDFVATLEDARDERPLQRFFRDKSHLLTCLLPPGREAWCFDRPRLGSEHIPDFLLCTRNSLGFQWVMVEIESPTKHPLNGSGLPSLKLNEALGQVRDWRSWLRQNIAYSQTELGFREITAECIAYVIIGRRSSIATKHASKYRELSTRDTSIMSYDRLKDVMLRGRTFMGAMHE